MQKKLKQYTFYLTEELAKAITLKTVHTGDDKSAVVRAALSEYLAAELKILEGVEKQMEMTVEQRKKLNAWQFGLGMSRLSGGEPSPEFLKQVEKEIMGEMSTGDMAVYLEERYRVKAADNDEEN